MNWGDVDLTERQISVSRSWCGTLKRMGPTKNKKERKVDISPATAETLKQLKRAEGAIPMPNTPVFLSKTGGRLSRKAVEAFARRCSPRKILPHDLRHTYATLRIAKGDNIVDVSNQLGHHDPGFTLRRYAKWMPGEHKQQVDALDALFGLAAEG